MGLERARRIEDAIRRAADALGRARYADEALSLVVVRREILVADRPVEAEAVGGLRLEVVVGHAQRDAAVVVGAPAENARSEPREVAAGRHRVGLALQLVAAVGGAVGEAGRSARVGLTPGAGAAMRHLIRPHVLLQVGHLQHRSGFEQEHRDAEIRQHLGDGAAACARAHDDDVVDGRSRRDLCHVLSPHGPRFAGPPNRSLAGGVYGTLRGGSTEAVHQLTGAPACRFDGWPVSVRRGPGDGVVGRSLRRY